MAAMDKYTERDFLKSFTSTCYATKCSGNVDVNQYHGQHENISTELSARLAKEILPAIRNYIDKDSEYSKELTAAVSNTNKTIFRRFRTNYERATRRRKAMAKAKIQRIVNDIIDQLFEEAEEFTSFEDYEAERSDELVQLQPWDNGTLTNSNIITSPPKIPHRRASCEELQAAANDFAPHETTTRQLSNERLESNANSKWKDIASFEISKTIVCPPRMPNRRLSAEKILDNLKNSRKAKNLPNDSKDMRNYQWFHSNDSLSSITCDLSSLDSSDCTQSKSISSTSSKDRDDKEIVSERSVNFSSVQCREYEQISFQKTLTSGSCIGIGWNFQLMPEISVDDFENRRAAHRKQCVSELLLSNKEREMIAMRIPFNCRSSDVDKNDSTKNRAHNGHAARSA